VLAGNDAHGSYARWIWISIGRPSSAADRARAGVARKESKERRVDAARQAFDAQYPGLVEFLREAAKWSTYLAYVDRKFSQESLCVIGQANKIIEEYDKQGLTLTLRQLYYQFVARGFLTNEDRSYHRLGNIINDGRLVGLVSWTAIEDTTRNLKGLGFYQRPAQAIKAVRESYRRDLWYSLPFRPEVWIEKAALEGVVQGICNQMRVDFFACRGYTSQSEQWRAGQRFANYVRKGQRPIVFHLGDHDPSGIDMTRDNRDRLTMFTGVPVQVVRLALNMSQVEQYNPPPNPAKLTDSRARGYVETYGDSSWELDALNPTLLRDLIRDAVYKIRDEKLWDEALAEETEDLRFLDSVIEESGL
jgi:hypothetical protein